jgi:Bacteriophage abortive infection AbiH
MDSKKLFIIGNGFDIHHGIPSRYSDFQSYLENKDRELCGMLDEYFDYDNLWADFEQSLADLDADYLAESLSTFLVSYGADDWSDSYHDDYQYEIKKVVTGLSTTLKSRFTEWVLQLVIPSASDIAYKRLTYIDANAIFLTFNYTNTLQVAYLVPENNVLHIHNKAENENSDLILGHAWKPVDKNSLMNREDIESQDVRIIQGDDIIDGYFKATYKATEEIIKANSAFFSNLHSIEDIYVLGHSMSSVDIAYFQELVKSINAKNTKWHISYFYDDEPEEHIETMNNLGIKARLISYSELQNI